MTDTVKKILSGDLRTASRLIRDIDDRIPEAREILKELYPHSGRAFIIGITGAPGVGKSTLTAKLVGHIRGQGLSVGVLAVDPSSPYTGGAFLGDRIRMQDHSTDEGVFIRSLATRGHFGGLTQSTYGAALVMDAMGKDVIVIETVGVGQGEVDISRTAHTTIIVLAPGMGDDVQAVKAGLLEVGDILVVNKMDKEDGWNTIQDMETMIELCRGSATEDRGWLPPVIGTSALQNKGIDDLWKAAQDHRRFIDRGACPHYHGLNRLKAELTLIDMARQQVVEALMARLEDNGVLDQYVDDYLARRTDPYSLCEKILAECTWPEAQDAVHNPNGPKPHPQTGPQTDPGTDQ